METIGKQVVQCDNCRQRMLPEENAHLQAKLDGAKGKPQDYHFCSEECLRVFLNKRAKRAKSTASLSFDGRSWEIELCPK
jgi:YHS domain-containing protein